MPNYTDAARIAELKRIAEIYKPDGMISYFSNEDLRLLLGRIAELEGQQGDLRNAVLEYDAAKSEFERLYAENPTMIGDWGDASRRERSSRDLIIKLAHEIAGLASADARGGEKNDGQ